jgi:hypothetical protein
MKYVISILAIAFALSGNIARADAYELTWQKLEKDHVEFIFNHHLNGAIDLDNAGHEVVTGPQGAPVSLIFDANGISAFFSTADGTTIHTLLKAHRAFLGLPEGVEVGFSVLVSQAPVMDFHRVYGLLELNNIVTDAQTVAKDLQSKEWRETTLALVKLLLCAQLDKLPTVQGLPPVLVTWVTGALKPSCSE